MNELFDLRVETWYSYRILLASSQGLTFEDLVEPLDLVEEGSDTGTEATEVTEIHICEWEGMREGVLYICNC
jgi:hypothetical protein